MEVVKFLPNYTTSHIIEFFSRYHEDLIIYLINYLSVFVTLHLISLLLLSCVAVSFTLSYATKALRESRGIALLYFDVGTRRG
jgi:hypothetical protein